MKAVNKATYDFSKRQKPISSIVTYNPRPVLKRKHQTYIRRNKEPALKYNKRHENLIGKDLHGKEAVSTYSLNLHNNKDLLRPSPNNK
jgi:hypothetical protein